MTGVPKAPEHGRFMVISGHSPNNLVDPD